MTDIVDQATRSRMMSGIKGKNTKPELIIRKSLHAKGFRFRLHVRDLPGKPDLVFPKYGAVLFVNGCFWHGHGCKYFKVPGTRTEFWFEKISSNRERDERNTALLITAGWRVFTVWECAVRSAIASHSIPALADRIGSWLVSGCQTGEHPSDLNIS